MSGTDLNQTAGAVLPLLGPNASTVAIAATGSSQTVAIPGAVSNGGYPAAKAPSTFVIDNTSPPGSGQVVVFVSFGLSAAAAAATISTGSTPGSYPCQPGKTVISVHGNPTFVGIVGSAAGPTNVYITPAHGKL